MMRDLHNSIKCSLAEPPVAAVTGDTAFVSSILDTANYGSAEYVWVAGSIADADVTFTLLVEDGDDASLTDAAAVADEHLLGTEANAAPLLSSDNKVGKIGYIGPKRYVRVTVTPANNTGNIFFAAIWIQGHPRVYPQSTQIV